MWLHTIPGFACAAKHFPGNGQDFRDAHIANNVNYFDVEEWDATYGKVYRTLIENDLDAIMGGHILMPKYAKAIYEGRKNWEFRKPPPPIFKTIYIYESAPVSKITGTVVFSEEIRGVPLSVYEIVKTNKCFTRNLPGITAFELEEYTGPLNLVSALRVHRAERLEHPITFNAKPPQNWNSIR